MSTQARKHAKHVSTQARKHAKHVSKQARQARKHAKHVSTQARQARDLADSYLFWKKNASAVCDWLKILTIWKALWNVIYI